MDSGGFKCWNWFGGDLEVLENFGFHSFSLIEVSPRREKFKNEQFKLEKSATGEKIAKTFLKIWHFHQKNSEFVNFRRFPGSPDSTSRPRPLPSLRRRPWNSKITANQSQRIKSNRKNDDFWCKFVSSIQKIFKNFKFSINRTAKKGNKTNTYQLQILAKPKSRFRAKCWHW